MRRCFACLVLAARLTCGQGNDADNAFGRGVRLQQAGDWDGAIREYRACLTQNPGKLEARSNLGAALAHTGRYQEAIQQYEASLAASPPLAASLHLRMNLSLAFYKSGRISDAARELENVRKNAPEDLNATLLLADCRFRLGEFGRVVELLKPLESEQRENHAFAYLLGTALIRNGQVEEGQVVVNGILKEGETAEAKLLLGSSFFMARDYPRAVQAFQQAIAIDSSLPSLYSYYGQSLLFTGDADGAAEAFRKQLAEDANDFDANLQLGEILKQRNQCGEALPRLERALLLRPGDLEARASIAACHASLGQALEAGRELEALVHDEPDSLAAHQQLSEVLERLGRKQEAGRERAIAKRLTALVVPQASDGLPVGTLAPDFELEVNGRDQRLRLSEWRGRRPLVLVFGSYTCPKFRSQADALNALYERYKDRAAFLLVYVREAHSDTDWKSTANDREGIALPAATTFSQKREYTAACVRKLKIPYRAVTDGMQAEVEKLYQGWPSRVYMLDAGGRVEYNSLLDELNFRSGDLEKAIAADR